MSGNLSIVKADSLIKEGKYVLDVRLASEREGGNFIIGSHHIPLNELRSRYNEIPQGKEVYVHCLSGVRSYNACRILLLYGYHATNLDGGFTSYKIFKKYGLTNVSEDIY